MSADQRSILLIAGEISGDMHAANLVRAFKERCPETRFFGVGGDALRAEGMDILYDVREMAVMGLNEVVQRYGFFRKVFRRLLRLIEEKQPDAVVLVDYAEFNLRFAAAAHAQGIKVIYYICPQVWAWRRHRIGEIAASVDKLITIFPFEEDVFKGTGLDVTFAGHPLVDEVARARECPPVELPWREGTRIAMLPGSRRHEVARILPVMLKAARCLEEAVPDAHFLIAAPSEEIAAVVTAIRERVKDGPTRCDTVTGKTRDVLGQARVAMVASGTATVETALMRCPMVIVYKTTSLTYLVGRALVRIPHIGMVNVIAKREICPEFIQGQATPASIAAAVKPLLGETDARRQMLSDLEEVADSLGEGGAAERAAASLEEALAT